MTRPLFPRKVPRQIAVPNGRRVYAIGDVHGRLDLLNQLLDLIAEDQRGRPWVEIEIVLLGDLIDRGPDSAGVVRRAMRPTPHARVTALMGNHEASMIQALQGDMRVMELWLNVGGVQALDSWGVDADLIDDASLEQLCEAANARIPQRELLWISQMPQSMLIGDYYFVHAGVRPGVPIEEQSASDSYWIRQEFLKSRRDHGAIVVHGHSAATQVDEKPNRIGLDTGAYQTGRLTALGLEGNERWFLST
jgi:serine/threonine protein phosphatase 1